MRGRQRARPVEPAFDVRGVEARRGSLDIGEVELGARPERGVGTGGEREAGQHDAAAAHAECLVDEHESRGAVGDADDMRDAEACRHALFQLAPGAAVGQHAALEDRLEALREARNVVEGDTRER